MRYLDSIRGALFGTACGDAIHKCLKYAKDKNFYKKSYKDIEKYYIHTSKGEITDDTRMMMGVANSIIENPQNPFAIMGKKFIDIYYDNPINLGLTIRIAVGEYEKCRDWKKAALKTHLILGGRSEGNGTLMRTIPVALYYDNIDKMIEFTKKQSNLTHYSKNAWETCVLYNTLVYRYMRGEDKIQAFIDILKNFPKYKDILNNNEDNMKKSGCSMDTLKCSLWCFLNTESYEEAVIKSIQVYENRDTIATITGGIAGVYYGYSKIKDVFKQKLGVKNELLDISSKFCNKEQYI